MDQGDLAQGECIHGPGLARPAPVGEDGDPVLHPKFREKLRTVPLAIHDQGEAAARRIGGKLRLGRLRGHFVEKAGQDGLLQIVEHPLVADRCHDEERRADTIADPVVHEGRQAQATAGAVAAGKLGLVAVVEAHMSVDIEDTGKRLVEAHPVLRERLRPLRDPTFAAGERVKLAPQGLHLGNTIQPEQAPPFARC